MFFDVQTRHAKLTVLGIGSHRNRKRNSSPFYNQIMGKKTKNKKAHISNQEKYHPNHWKDWQKKRNKSAI